MAAEALKQIPDSLFVTGHSFLSSFLNMFN